MTPAPAQSDPITNAAEEIAELQTKLDNLTYKDEVKSLIDDAVIKLEQAKQAQNALSEAVLAYEQAVISKDQADLLVTQSQEIRDSQSSEVENALNDKLKAEAELDAANINFQTAQMSMQSAGNQGWAFTAYYLNRSNGIAFPGEAYCSGVLTQPYHGMPICGRYENMYVVYSGKITAPDGVNNISFAGYTDDGFRMYVDGQLVINQWWDQGSTWSPYYYHTFTSEDRVIDVSFHYFNGGGPGVFHVGWGHSGMWTGVSPSAMSYGNSATQEQIDSYNVALSEKQDAQQAYNSAVSTYNQELSLLEQYNEELNQSILARDSATIDLELALTSKSNAESDYSSKISILNVSIDAAWEAYNKQFEFEEKQRIAAAIANAIKPIPQPEPTPEPTIEPSPEPTVEPSTEPTVDPEPTIEPTPEPGIDPEPSLEPTEEQATDPTPEPTEVVTPEPTPEKTPGKNEESTPVEPAIEDKPVVSQNMANIIADLTSANTLTKLTEEQKEAVAGILGISTEEIAVVAELAKSDPVIAQALEEFADRAQENADAPMPYTLADAITETQAEEFLSDPLSAITDINVGELLSNFSELGSDMTDDQREKAQEVIIPVVIVSQIASAVISMRR